ncbi:hypothetical protein [Ignicoccus hospitalis]|uniref:Uncharacterized protein n=1 Tax=Ignicoccus hospitalis (strain KIN4/I / DSM 18386 / JCM 14125) TaxID=453591 RepID=A8AC36_IGNH4|nr:hypothetical protein [Ignicoccus hospitalis]ABU82488.1 hypothetical protein Igni_1312 [Ignicoccus hospitalis KIN4/I]HIH90585.1 hypothetical protein [Desulfurococcaceae archaeon]
MRLVHLWTRRVASDEPVVREGPEGHVAVSADFTAYLIRPDGKLLAKKYYKGTRLGKPCVSSHLTLFPAENSLFMFENKRGKPSGVVRLNGKGVDCAFNGDRVAVLTERRLTILEWNGDEGKMKAVEEIKVRPRGLSVDWKEEIVVGTEDGLLIGREKVKVGRVELVAVGPLIAAAVPGGLALLDGKEVVRYIEGLEVTGIAWLGDLIAVGDRGKKRVVVLDVSGKLMDEFRFPGAVRSMDWVTVLAVAQRRKVMGYLLLPEELEGGKAPKLGEAGGPAGI